MRNTGNKASLLTRRDWAALVATVPLATQVASSKQAVPPPAAGLSSPVDDVRKTSEQLAQIEVPMSLEPALAFHV